MNFYTFAKQRGNNILLRGVFNGKRFTRRVGFKPSLFVNSAEPTEWTSLHGESLQCIEFEDINTCKQFVETYSDVDNFSIHGQTNYGYQFLSKYYPHDIEWDISSILVYTLDIETSSEQGFPQIDNPTEEILLITLRNLSTKKIYSWGCRPFDATKMSTSKSAHLVKYTQCSSEQELLESFMQFYTQEYPDIVTGWNVNMFDIPYLISRMRYLMGEDATKKFSPWGAVKSINKTINNKYVTVYDLFGVEIIDYLDLYKKFTYANQESYKLDHIASVELKRKKLEHGYDTLKELYTKDWQLFTEYNIIDVELVDQLEDKLKLIELLLTMAYDAKCNYSDIFSQVRTWDCIVYNHLLKKNVIIPNKTTKRVARIFEGAYVKEPRSGHYEWVVSFDATSLYPSIIMQYNMSPEMFEYDMTKRRNTNVEGLLKKEYTLDSLRDEEYCMTANGYCYRTNKLGFFPEIVERMFQERQDYKKQMILAQKEYESTKNPAVLKDISRFNNFQMARKIQLNSLFGAYGSEYFRYYDDRVAEGITMTGQYIIRHVGNALNAYLNTVCGTTDFDFSFYSDTDSCYVTLDPLVKKYYADLPKDKIIDIIDTICKTKIQEVLDEVCQDIAQYTNAFQQKITFKREAIADKGLWVSKKRYALNVYDNEGVRYATPKLKVMGLEIVRSSTPSAIRDALKDAVKICLDGKESTLHSFIQEMRTKFFTLSPEDIAFPRSVNGLEKYAHATEIYTKGTPMHVRASLLYNKMIVEKQITQKYEKIEEGNKIKFLYLNERNPLRQNCMAFMSKLPKEFELHRFVDYDMMFQKTFIEPLQSIIEGLNWTTEPQSSLDSLF